MKYILFSVFLLLISIVISQKFRSTRISQEQLDVSSDNVETVDYEILSITKGYQIRKYPELTIATTRLNSNSYSYNSNTGFRKIASYIFGGNSSNKQIAMTSPVQMDMGPEPTMSFFMPGNLDISELPVPNRNDVFVTVQPSKIVAVIEFSGWASDAKLIKHFNALKSKLIEDSLEFEDRYSFLGYDPPYKLSNRRNEIIIPLTNYEN